MSSIQAAHPGDLELVRKAQEGDRLAFGELYRCYAPVIHGILLARIPFSDVADEVQEVFVIAINRISDLRRPEAFAAWLCSIARHRAADFHRRKVVFDELVEIPVADNSADLGEVKEAIRAILILPEAYRETLILRLVEGLTGPEISQRTGMTEGSVRVNLHRGMQMLREVLAGGSK